MSDAGSAATPMFPLQSAVLPGEVLPLRVFEPRYSALVEHCLSQPDPAFGVVLIARGREVGGGDVRHDVGTLARIAEYADGGSGRYSLKCVVQERFRVAEWLPDDPYPRAVLELWPDEAGAMQPGDLADLEDESWSVLESLARAGKVRLPPRSELFGDLAAEPSDRLYELSALLPIGAADRYAVLAAPGVPERLAALRDAVETIAARVAFGSS